MLVLRQRNSKFLVNIEVNNRETSHFMVVIYKKRGQSCEKVAYYTSLTPILHLLTFIKGL